MKKFICPLLAFISCALASAAPFTALQSDDFLEPYGVGTITWRLSSQLTKDATGVIELCYVEKGGPVQVLGRVGVRPFVSNRSTMPDLRILFAKTEIEAKTKVVLIVGYGLRSGCFVVDVPGLVSHSLTPEGLPEADSKGIYTLLMHHNNQTVYSATRIQDAAGRLYFHYVPQTK